MTIKTLDYNERQLRNFLYRINEVFIREQRIEIRIENLEIFSKRFEHIQLRIRIQQINPFMSGIH